jgi:hypothetical protein
MNVEKSKVKRISREPTPITDLDRSKTARECTISHPFG